MPGRRYVRKIVEIEILAVRKLLHRRQQPGPIMIITGLVVRVSEGRDGRARDFRLNIATNFKKVAPE